MTNRQPKGSPVGGQFAEGRKPEGSDLVVTSIMRRGAWNLSITGNDFTPDEIDLEHIAEMVKDGFTSGELVNEERGWWTLDINEIDEGFKPFDSDLEHVASLVKDGCTSGQLANEEEIESEPATNRETGTFTLGDHTYEFEKTGPENDLTEYTLTNAEGGGGWRFGYDRLTRRVAAHGVAPVRPSAEWRDKGEADIRTVARLFEPDARLIQLDGETYLIGGNPWPLSPSHLQGIATGEMMLNNGKTEHDLRAYVSQQRSDTARSETERPDMAKSFAETRSYIDGIEIAINLGEEAAKANTVGAMDARFKEKS